MQFEFKGVLSPLFGWLHVDPDTLVTYAEKNNWTCQIVQQEESGDYLARLFELTQLSE